MIVISARAHLRELGISMGFSAALPDAACAGNRRFPYVLCLHDYGCNGETLLQSLCCASVVDKAGVALLLPNGQNGCFMNMAHGPQWETYLLQGLLPFAQRTFPLRGKPGLFGAGTGGWAAARLAGRYPDRFAASVAAGAWEDVPGRYKAGECGVMPDLEAVFGDPQTMPAFALCPDTRRFSDPAEALRAILNVDWSASA